MPKKIPMTEMRNWLNSYEGGKSEASIAKVAHRDVRTVKKGIDQARRERDAQTARAGLLTEALRKHQGGLLGIIEGIVSALQVPPPNLEVHWKSEDSLSPIRLSGATVRHELREGWAVVFDSENSLLWGLLQQHLKRDKMWEVLERWKKALAVHVHARIALKLKTATLLEKKTGLKIVERVAEQKQYLLSYTAVPLLYAAALDRALGKHYRTDLEHKLVAYTKSGEVTYHNSTVAKVPGAEEECKKNILEACTDLMTSNEAWNIAAAYGQLQELTAKAKQVAEELLLLGLVPGQCRVCRRLGA